VKAHVLLKVQDTTQGISEENIKTLFEPFFTTKEVKGKGLGLSVRHGVIRSHSSKTTAQIKVGEGSAFSITVPI
jgi:two-component system, NtrC family, sensor kinase